ncbi:MAG: DUF2378 family protein [Candidatus Omnitrophota bacterium]
MARENIMQALIKGMFLNILLNYLKKNSHDLVTEKVSKMLDKPLKYVDFFDYPIEEFILLIEEIIKQVFPDKTFEEACYELGRISVEGIIISPVAKVAIAYAKKNIQGAIKNTPFYFSQFAKMGKVSVNQKSDYIFNVVFKAWKIYPYYAYGLLVFVLKEIDAKLKLKLEVANVKILGLGKVESDFTCILELPEGKK